MWCKQITDAVAFVHTNQVFFFFITLEPRVE